jgi:hypothetical protein
VPGRRPSRAWPSWRLERQSRWRRPQFAPRPIGSRNRPECHSTREPSRRKFRHTPQKNLVFWARSQLAEMKERGERQKPGQAIGGNSRTRRPWSRFTVRHRQMTVVHRGEGSSKGLTRLVSSCLRSCWVHDSFARFAAILRAPAPMGRPRGYVYSPLCDRHLWDVRSARARPIAQGGRPTGSKEKTRPRRRSSARPRKTGAGNSARLELRSTR